MLERVEEALPTPRLHSHDGLLREQLSPRDLPRLPHHESGPGPWHLLVGDSDAKESAVRLYGLGERQEPQTYPVVLYPCEMPYLEIADLVGAVPQRSA